MRYSFQIKYQIINMEEQLLDDRRTQDMDVYLSVNQTLDISHCIITAILIENNHATQVFAFQSSQNHPIIDGYKQIPQSFHITLTFEVKQQLKIYVHECGTNRLIGSIENLTVGELAGRQNGVGKPLMNGNSKVGDVHVYYQTTENEDELIVLSLESKDIISERAFLCLCPSDYYFTITKSLAGRTIEVYRSQSTNKSSYVFETIRISSHTLCNQKFNQEFTFNFHSCSKNTLIGQTSCMLAQLQRNQVFLVTNGKENKGKIIVTKTASEKQYCFLSYCKSGMQIAMVLGIDFTMSNKPYKDPLSLHYWGEGKNSYEKVLKQVCPILLNYDSDKEVPTFGFGAKVKFGQIDTKGKVSHCFPISGNKEKPDLTDLKGIIQGYRNCLPHLEFARPTLLAPIIRQCKKKCLQMKKERKQYMLLMLVTDGDIDDFQNAADEIVECSRLPISIIIVGLTLNKDQSWQIMRKLDNNGLDLTHRNGSRAERDLVKFVSFQDCHNDPDELSRQVLEEFPRQVQEYHRRQKITPNDYTNNSQVQEAIMESEAHVVTSSTFRRKAFENKKQMDAPTQRQKRLPSQKQRLKLDQSEYPLESQVKKFFQGVQLK